jgi:hypothetical protein
MGTRKPLTKAAAHISIDDTKNYAARINVQMTMEYVSSSPTITVKSAQLQKTEILTRNQNRLAPHLAGLFLLAQK